jgi:hypothetical protein
MKVICLTILIFFAYSVYAQTYQLEQISTSGGFYESRSGFSINWTLGETITSTRSNNHFTITQGFNQPFFKSVSVSLLNNPKYTLQAFPNPADEMLTIVVDQPSKKLRIISLRGILVIEKEILNKIEIIDLNEIPNGNYIVQYDKFKTLITVIHQ